MPEYIKCSSCLGCNLLELPQFRGKKECDNYVSANKSALDICKKILEGEQITFGGNKE